MRNYLNLQQEKCAVSDKRHFRYYVYDAFYSPFPLTALLLITALGLPPKNSLSKGQAMNHPTCGRRPEQLTLNLDNKQASSLCDEQATHTNYIEVSNPKEVSTVVPVGQSASSPLAWLLEPQKSRHFGELGSGNTEQTFDRILARLIQQEAHEREASLRDDYRIAWLIVRFCQTGEAKLCTPQVLATYKVIGCHPDQVWNRIVARRQAVIGHPAFIPVRPKSSPVPIDAARRKA